MATGFKGTKVDIVDLKILSKTSSGMLVKFDALFSDNEGTVHGHVLHELAVEEGSDLHAAVKQIIDLCRTKVEIIHFTTPDAPSMKARLTRGIAETVSGSTDPVDDLGEEG